VAFAAFAETAHDDNRMQLERDEAGDGTEDVRYPELDMRQVEASLEQIQSSTTCIGSQ
jgi:hypothetical protein